MHPDTRADVRAALLACDQPAMDRLMLLLGLSGHQDTDVEAVLREELAAAGHEVQRFWLGDCNCHGRLN